jgi:hypothetical protein
MDAALPSGTAAKFLSEFFTQGMGFVQRSCNLFSNSLFLFCFAVVAQNVPLIGADQARRV